MLNSLKWELINFYQKYKIIVWLIGIVLLLSLIVPINTPFSTVLAVVLSSIMAICVATVMFIIVFRMVWNIRNKNASLELTVERKPWEYIMAKLISNVTILIVTYVLAMLMQLIMTKFSTENITYFNISSNYTSIIELLLSFILTPLSVFIAYVLAKSFKITRRNAIMWTIIIIILILIAVGALEIIIKIVSGAEVLIKDSGIQINVQHMNNAMNNGCSMVLTVVLIIIGIMGGSKLLEKRFEL